MKGPRQLGSYVAAALLTAITLATFAVFKDYGPESAVRRFHRAVARIDVAELERVSLQGVDSQATQLLANRLREFGSEGATFEIVGIRRFPNGRYAAAAVEYHLANGMTDGAVWFVYRKASQWQVDTQKTNAAWANPMPWG